MIVIWREVLARKGWWFAAHFFSQETPHDSLQEALFDDPVVGATLRRLATEDPDLIAAVADVERSQVRDFLDKSPWQRVEQAMDLAEFALRARHVP